MLSFPHRVGETLLIGDEITFTFLNVKDRDQPVRLSVNTPQNIPVLCQELVEGDAARRRIKPGIPSRK